MVWTNRGSESCSSADSRVNTSPHRLLLYLSYCTSGLLLNSLFAFIRKSVCLRQVKSLETQRNVSREKGWENTVSVWGKYSLKSWVVTGFYCTRWSACPWNAQISVRVRGTPGLSLQNLGLVVSRYFTVFLSFWLKSVELHCQIDSVWFMPAIV